MSSFLDLVGSIGGDKAPPPPIKTSQSISRPSAASVASLMKAIDKPTIVTSSSTYKGTAKQVPGSINTLKRKADEISTLKTGNSAASTPSSTTSTQRPVLDVNGPTSATSLTRESSLTNNDANTALQTSTKSATSGSSYATMLARAKENAANKLKKPQPTIQHKPTEKPKPLTLTERRAQSQQALSTKIKASITAKGRLDARRRSISPTKQGFKDTKLSRPDATKPIRPPVSTYKGTMGRSTHKPRDKHRGPSRHDEYLGTDEEDEGDDMDEDDGYGYRSDASSEDMEAGLGDLEIEEYNALKAAKDDDAMELALENKLKREKQQRKLAELAARHKKK